MTYNFISPLGTFTLTKTMLDKHIIDANKTVADLFGCYDDIDAGESITYDGECFTTLDQLRIRCYRAKGRGDRRISISGLKKRATAGDEIWIFKRLDHPRFANRPPFVVVNATVVFLTVSGEQQFKNDALENGLIEGSQV